MKGEAGVSEDARDGGAAGARAETEAGAEAEAPPTHPRVRLSVENFGPIEKGEVELRPLNVFVGPSNTGKTYLAVLIYGLHQALDSFSGFPFFAEPFMDIAEENIEFYYRIGDEITEQETHKMMELLRTSGGTIHFSDLPLKLREFLHDDLLNDHYNNNIYSNYISNHFDIEALPDIVSNFAQGKMKISLTSDKRTRNKWRFNVSIDKTKTVMNCQVDDLDIHYKNKLPQKQFADIYNDNHKKKANHVMEKLLYAAHFSDSFARQAYYLPAARTGIMQSYRVIASSVMPRLNRVSLKRLHEMPTVSGLLTDFMQRLILYREPDEDGEHRGERERSIPIRKLAETLERETLKGNIQALQAVPGGLREFVYRPRNMESDIRLSRASSMVTELAPVVLFLRSGVEPGDTLIIEEPEAHLHPAAQTEMAKLLAELANAGVQVIVTTHSDFLVQEIGNLMRAGELAAKTGGKEGGETRLRPEDVGVWLFRRGEEGAGSTVEEIPFDRIEGVEPPEYNEIYEEIYNRSATLQNRLAEAGLETPE